MNGANKHLHMKFLVFMISIRQNKHYQLYITNTSDTGVTIVIELLLDLHGFLVGGLFYRVVIVFGFLDHHCNSSG